MPGDLVYPAAGNGMSGRLLPSSRYLQGRAFQFPARTSRTGWDIGFQAGAGRPLDGEETKTKDLRPKASRRRRCYSQIDLKLLNLVGQLPNGGSAGRFCRKSQARIRSNSMTAQKIALFPDTNLFLHYRPLNETDWCSLLRASTVEIKIATVVTGELEEQKALNPSRKLRDRAATAVKLLHKHLGHPQVRDGVTLEFLIKEPTLEFASSRGLNLRLGDDRLIGTLLLYREDNPDIRCMLVTGDLPLTVKATHYQIELLPLDEALLLPSEPDPLERKNKQLEAELLRYRSRQPVLDIRFPKGESYARFRIVRPSESSDPEPEIQSKLAAAKEKCQPVDLKPRREAGASASADNPFAQIAELMERFQTMGRQFHEDYNFRVAAYHRAYEKYLRDVVAFKTLATRTVKLDLILANTGTCPAEDIHVSLHFPDGFALYDEEHPPKQPEEPAIPSKEMNLMPSVSLPYFPDIHRLPELTDPSLPRIRKTKSYDVTFEYEKLQHGFVWTLTPLYAAFDSWESAQSFSIDYTIHAGNMIDEQTGELGVVIEKD
jgi:hypothetical protein